MIIQVIKLILNARGRRLELGLTSSVRGEFLELWAGGLPSSVRGEFLELWAGEGLGVRKFGERFLLLTHASYRMRQRNLKWNVTVKKSPIPEEIARKGIKKVVFYLSLVQGLERPKSGVRSCPPSQIIYSK